MRRRRRKSKGGDAAVPVFPSSFTPEILAEIFKTVPGVPDRLLSRESGWTEFKETYHRQSWSDYARTLAGFANAEGGYIVFGVADKPRRLVGLKGTSFEEMEQERLTQYLNGIFSPSICWESVTHGMSGKNFGLIYAHKAREKPIIATKTEDKIKEGDILYRYRGMTRRILHPELRLILEEQRRRERNDWLRHFLKVAKIGVENAAVMDVNSGLVTGPRGSFVIDESLLPKIKFVKEGEFKETSGAPTLKLVGDVRPLKGGFVQPVRTVTTMKPVAIRTPDIVHACLDGKPIVEPMEYIKQLCFEPASMLPVYCFMQQAGMKKDDVLEFLKGVRSRSPSRERLIARLKSGDTSLAYPIPGPISPSAIKRAKFRERILAKDSLDGVPPTDLRYAIQSIRSLKKKEIDTGFLLPLLKQWFDAYYTDRDVDLAGDLRGAICHVDKVLNDGII